MDIKKLSESTANKFKSDPGLIMLDALAGAFALIATADGNVDRMETSKYFEIIKNIEDLQKIPIDRAEAAFNSAIDAIKKNGVDGTEAALSAVQAAKGNSENVELILMASQAAIVADLQLKDAEESVLQKICNALGIDPEEY